ncbi:MAG: glycosyltransferase family 9 protein, partial [Phycisphaerae bacterium]|nr:glycosyltransferase family 9 protein [Phycisphaerae bacterium]
MDRIGEAAIGFNRFKGQIENLYYRRTQREGFESIYLDLPQHGYVSRIEQGRYIWKTGGHIIDILAASVGLNGLPHQCELFLTPEEENKISDLIKQNNMSIFITIEPNTNADFFGDLRAWPFEKWQAVVDWLGKNRKGICVVQVGVAGARPLNGVINFCGRLSFREAAVMIGRSRLFLGTEGGLMHAANAVKTRGLVVWSGLTDPSFASYPEKDEI